MVYLDYFFTLLYMLHSAHKSAASSLQWYVAVASETNSLQPGMCSLISFITLGTFMWYYAAIVRHNAL